MGASFDAAWGSPCRMAGRRARDRHSTIVEIHRFLPGGASGLRVRQTGFRRHSTTCERDCPHALCPLDILGRRTPEFVAGVGTTASKRRHAKKAARVHSIGRGNSFETAVRKPCTQNKNIGAFGGIELKIN
jgi:hypothetical protein